MLEREPKNLDRDDLKCLEEYYRDPAGPEEPAEDDHARQLPEPVPHGELLGVRVLEPYAER